MTDVIITEILEKARKVMMCALGTQLFPREGGRVVSYRGTSDVQMIWGEEAGVDIFESGMVFSFG